MCPAVELVPHDAEYRYRQEMVVTFEPGLSATKTRQPVHASSSSCSHDASSALPSIAPISRASTRVASGAVGLAGGTYYLLNPDPIDEDQWYFLAQTHNASVRRKYGLSVGVAPYAHADGGGLSFAGQF
jgi:hypothetical protein